MTAKEFLRQYQDCERRIRSRLRRIERLKEQAESITQTLSEHVQSSGSGDRQARIIDTYVDMEDELGREVKCYQDIQRRVCCAVETLEDGRQRDVLERYYIEGMTFEQVAVDLHYSFRWVCVLHGQALEKLKEFIEVHIPPVV